MHRKTGFNIIYPWFLKYWQVNYGCHKTDACVRHALDLHSIIYNSAVQLQFSLIGLNVNICFESAILEIVSRNTTGYFNRHCDFKEAFSYYLLSKNWTVAERKRGLPSSSRAISSRLVQVWNTYNSVYFLWVCLRRMSKNPDWTTVTCMSERHQLPILFHWNDRTDGLHLTFDFVFQHPRLNTSGV